MGAGRERLQAALDAIGEKGMDELVLPQGWSAKDLLAHIGAWEERAANVFEALLQGKEFESIEGEQGMDAFNASAYETWRERPLEEVRTFEEEAYARYERLIESATEEDLFDPQRFALLEGEPYFQWVVGNTFGHYDEHLQDMRK